MDATVGIDWSQVFARLFQLALAFLIAFPVGWNRERTSRSAGLRTFPLVSVGACAFSLIGIQVLQGSDAEARIIYGIITGIGFIGGGAILKDRGGVIGTATAASIWNTGAIGTAVAFGLLEIALVLSALNFITLQFGRTLKSAARADKPLDLDE